MTAVFEILFPVLALIATGLVAARFCGFSEAATNGVAQFVYNFATPVMLVRLFSTTVLPDQIPWALIGSYVLPQYGIYALVLLTLDRSARGAIDDNVIVAASSTFSNLLLVGFPLVVRVFGEAGTVPLFIITSFHGIAAFTVATILLEVRRRQQSGMARLPGAVLRNLGTNPIILAMAAGTIMNQLDWRLPGPVDEFAALMQDALTPCALFAVGASLMHYRIQGHLLLPCIMVGVKNMLFPLTVWCLAVFVFALEPLTSSVLVLMAALPTGVTVFVIGERLLAGRQFTTTMILLSNVFSLLSLGFVLYLMTALPKLFIPPG